jgi:hypothetical protein
MRQRIIGRHIASEGSLHLKGEEALDFVIATTPSQLMARCKLHVQLLEHILVLCPLRRTIQSHG